uniref:Uncharacterized protein n=1 Tax=Oryza brachyantha TaxID=4533 RepID=J3KZC9_ORYBR
YELPEGFHVLEPPPPMSAISFPLLPTLEEEIVVTAEDLGYVSTPCPFPPSDVNDLNPPDDHTTPYRHPAFDDDGDLFITHEDMWFFRYGVETPPRDVHSPTTRFKRHR